MNMKPSIFLASTALVATLLGAESALAKVITVQPIQVCNDHGTNCTVWKDDWATATQNIYNQAGAFGEDITVNFLDPTTINRSTYMPGSLQATDLSGSPCWVCTILSDNGMNGRSADASIYNMWLAPALEPGLYGDALIYGNGSVISTNLVNGSDPDRWDVFAHELGHNLGLWHTSESRTEQFPKTDPNLMASGNTRIVPISLSQLNNPAPYQQLSVDQLTEEQINTVLLPTPVVVPDSYTRGTPEMEISIIGLSANDRSSSALGFEVPTPTLGFIINHISEAPNDGLGSPKYVEILDGHISINFKNAANCPESMVLEAPRLPLRGQYPNIDSLMTPIGSSGSKGPVYFFELPFCGGIPLNFVGTTITLETFGTSRKTLTFTVKPPKDGTSQDQLNLNSRENLVAYYDSSTMPEGYIYYPQFNGIHAPLEYEYDPTSNPVPEPTSLLLLGIGLAGIRLTRRRLAQHSRKVT